LKLKRVKFIGDSLLTINQVKGIFQYKEPLLQKYKKMMGNFLQSFEKYDLEATPRSTNRFIDAIAPIRSLMLENPHQQTIYIEIVQITQSSLEMDGVEHVFLDITMEDKILWHIQLVKFLQDGILPANFKKLARKALKLKAYFFLYARRCPIS